MGEMADFALDQIMDIDEQYDSKQSSRNPFVNKRKSRGLGDCPVCQGAMHLCDGPYGPFWGCNNFPNCKGRRGS
jgi:ssDNA-binding Zn-finger/Zn-ribbon topoisomerase 1